ncbi:unnamed protein product [Haemonchus placei]|uniref:Poly [ADP-ribose] polymerase n=1 Tax=Haemonchus placei TaxID=6290 RepID=A0A3P7X5R0_HAEPC|nr:unnamed protein product [Haemonchus placei]
MMTYRCTGQLSEYTKCTYRNDNPDREKFVIPKDMKENSYLKKLKVNVTNVNSYIFYLFRSWGRVGTVIGGTRTESFRDEGIFKAYFRLFLEKSGNEWKQKHRFKKLPGRMDLVETDFSELVCVTQFISKYVSTKKLFICSSKINFYFVFSFYVDNKRMLKILAEKADADKILDATNRFYTLIPHSFGMAKPTLLNSTAIIKEKCDMLGSLLEIQIAYEVIKQEEDEDDATRDPVDIHYEKLKSGQAVCGKYSWRNTHLVQIGTDILGRGFAKKFKADIGNRRLLWHGSGTANYGGILSQGLRIAPPEAPVTGYMFGKGVYFADMASKSANYCRVFDDNADGLMLLCDVALGKVKEEINAVDHSLKTIKGYNSVQGMSCFVFSYNIILRLCESLPFRFGRNGT